MIRSENFIAGQSGFRIKAGGDVEFNQAVFRGRVEAEEGYIKNAVIEESAVFEGTIDSGPIYASNNIPGSSGTKSWANNTKASKIKSDLGIGAIGSTAIVLTVVSGSYGSNSVKELRFIGGNFGAGGAWKLDIVYTNNTLFSVYENGVTTAALTITTVLTGKTLILRNLPTNAVGLPVGAVYAQGNQLMIVT